MSEALALLSTICLTAALAAWTSHILFRDYREGFRMLYHWTSDAAPPSDVEPRESQRSIAVQVAFTATFLILAVLGYIAFHRLFE